MCAQLKNVITVYFVPKNTKMGSVHFQWEYAWPG